MMLKEFKVTCRNCGRHTGYYKKIIKMWRCAYCGNEQPMTEQKKER